jgi:TetR/AcrR family transcriptional regulator
MKPQSLRERLRESTYAAILDAAEAAAADEGLAAASLQSIAQRAGTAVGTIYNYFPDRQQLFDELFTRRREELFHAIEGAAKRDARAAFEAQLRGFVQAVFTHFDSRRTFLRLALEAEQMRPAVIKGNDGKRRPAMHQLQAHAQRIMGIGVREKRLLEEKVALAATVLVSIVRGVLVARVDDEGSLAAETDLVVSMFLHGAAR